MSRVQVSDQFGGQQLQTQARPVAATEQAAAPEQETRWKGLADAFAQGAGLADTIRQQAEVDEKAAAKRWAQSMTVGELGKAIQEGKMLPSQSPVFVGTAQHIWGVNSHEAGMRDITSKLTKGELKFNSPEEADQYLTEWRNTTLAGQSDYAKAGFDKAYAQTRDKVMDQVSKINDGVWVENAKAQGTDFLANGLNAVSSADFKGTPQEAAAQLMQQYQLMRHTKTLPDATAKAAMGEMVVRMAASGRKDILDAFLDTDMEGIGKVRGFLGETKALTYSNHAKTVFDGQQRKRVDDEVLPFYRDADNGALSAEKFTAWHTDPRNKDFISAATVHSIERANLAAIARQQNELFKSQVAGAVQASQTEAERKIEAALVSGQLPTVMGTNKPQVLDKHGEPKDMTDKDVQDLAEKIAVRRTQGLPFEQQVGFFAQNGLKNPNWENTIQAAFFNLNTIGVDSNGKPRGTLNDAGKAGLELFKQLNLYGDYAKTLMPEKQSNRFDNIAFLTKMGRSVDDAAGLATAVDMPVVEGSDVDKLVKGVRSQVGKLQSDPFYKFGWAQRMWGDNTVANTAQMTGTLRRYSELLAHSGQYPDATSAIEASFKYLAHPEVTAKVNGTVYLRTEMPNGPPSKTQDEWFERFINEVPKARAKELYGKPQEVRLEWNPASSAYQAYVGVMPMTNADHSLAVYTKENIQKWYATKEQADVLEAVSKRPEVKQKADDEKRHATKRAQTAKTVTTIENVKEALTPRAPGPLPKIDFTGITSPDRNARPGQPQRSP
ncbi:hypothetical protein H4CHR_03749 [Variovorax sp. PBS-H4]|uniref:hypothetical protein n=1 Tax=Variovorax sp. PBS-H4 TaxID=434008 RepID=UPI001317F7FD|nr:hypothetical protein [Variovorax sp. PBS-H4]VTU35794.1 hypothetical protein H4CHR_03749 [Variovorax sp. PBS-H4]